MEDWTSMESAARTRIERLGDERAGIAAIRAEDLPWRAQTRTRLWGESMDCGERGEWGAGQGHASPDGVWTSTLETYRVVEISCQLIPPPIILLLIQ